MKRLAVGLVVLALASGCARSAPPVPFQPVPQTDGPPNAVWVTVQDSRTFALRRR